MILLQMKSKIKLIQIPSIGKGYRFLTISFDIYLRVEVSNELEKPMVPQGEGKGLINWTLIDKNEETLW